ncbi:MAG: hypothetical protein HY725_19900 [Candidatus Rokubacteria bacterium]|nr:hypothetical protein [Candidatus Rokubacteria bacterium]
MRVLFLLRDGPEKLCGQIIDLHSREHEVTVIDLSEREVPYERIVAEICAHDRVIAW